MGSFVSSVSNHFWIPLLNVASKVGCSGCVFEVLRELSDELVTPSCSRVVEVKVRYGLGLTALPAGISRSAVSAFSNANWSPVVAEFDHKGADIISEGRNYCSIGSPLDGTSAVLIASTSGF
jgi:hypothetical protein